MGAGFLESGFDCIERVQGAVDGKTGHGTGLGKVGWLAGWLWVDGGGGSYD